MWSCIKKVFSKHATRREKCNFKNIFSQCGSCRLFSFVFLFANMFTLGFLEHDEELKDIYDFSLTCSIFFGCYILVLTVFHTLVTLDEEAYVFMHMINYQLFSLSFIIEMMYLAGNPSEYSLLLDPAIMINNVMKIVVISLAIADAYLYHSIDSENHFNKLIKPFSSIRNLYLRAMPHAGIFMSGSIGVGQDQGSITNIGESRETLEVELDDIMERGESSTARQCRKDELNPSEGDLSAEEVNRSREVLISELIAAINAISRNSSSEGSTRGRPRESLKTPSVELLCKINYGSLIRRVLASCHSSVSREDLEAELNNVISLITESENSFKEFMRRGMDSTAVQIATEYSELGKRIRASGRNGDDKLDGTLGATATRGSKESSSGEFKRGGSAGEFKRGSSSGESRGRETTRESKRGSRERSSTRESKREHRGISSTRKSKREHRGISSTRESKREYRGISSTREYERETYTREYIREYERGISTGEFKRGSKERSTAERLFTTDYSKVKERVLVSKKSEASGKNTPKRKKVRASEWKSPHVQQLESIFVPPEGILLPVIHPQYSSSKEKVKRKALKSAAALPPPCETSKSGHFSAADEMRGTTDELLPSPSNVPFISVNYGDTSEVKSSTSTGDIVPSDAENSEAVGTKPKLSVKIGKFTVTKVDESEIRKDKDSNKPKYQTVVHVDPNSEGTRCTDSIQDASVHHGTTPRSSVSPKLGSEKESPGMIKRTKSSYNLQRSPSITPHKERRKPEEERSFIHVRPATSYPCQSVETAQYDLRVHERPKPPQKSETEEELPKEHTEWKI